MRAVWSVAFLVAGCGSSSNPAPPPTTVAVRPAAVVPREVHVTRADVQALLTGEGGTDMTPVVERGKTVGMRLVGAGPETTAGRLGAATDDIIYSIGGHPLDSIPAAYQAGDAVAQQSRIEILGSRNGVAYTLVLVVDR